MQQRAGVWREELAPAPVLRGGRLKFGPLAFLDHGIHEVSLTPGVELLAHEPRGLRQLAMGAHEGAHRRASGRHLVEQGNIEVAVKRERQRARDRRRRHDEHVRARGPGGQLGPLADAEFVLLVDHDQRRPPHGFGREKQGVRADDDAGRGPGVRFFPPRRGAQNHRDAERVEELAEVVVMLLGEDLRGRHERRRLPGSHGGKHRGRRDDGFAAAHVAVQQAVHRLAGRHVVENRREHALLRAGEREGQRLEKPREQRAAPPDHGRGPRRVAQALTAQDALHFKKFAAREMRPRRLERLP